MRAAIIATISVLMMSSCGKEETIKGRPVSEWIDRLDDRNEETRIRAAMTLREASADALKPARKRLLELANRPQVKIDGGIYGDKAAAQIVLEEKFGIYDFKSQ